MENCNKFEGQGPFLDSIDHLIPENIKFETLEEKIVWFKDTVRIQRVREKLGEDQRLRNVFLKAIKDSYRPKYPEIFEFNENLICDKTREWLKTEELDENGIPTCVQ